MFVTENVDESVISPIYEFMLVIQGHYGKLSGLLLEHWKLEIK